MPGMFSRRRGSASSHVNVAPSSNAAIAATSAFLKNSASTTSLSSAAAAAALRSQTTSPVPVGSLQTKRMIRRGSQSSIGSSSATPARGGGAVRGGLVRQNSFGSMTDRTFRSPSPGRPASRSAVPAAADAPPLPSLPAQSSGSYRRSASLEPPMRVTSPTPAKGSRYSSVDRRSFVGTGAQRISSLPQLQELEREESQRSVNFSRPMSPSTSPPTSPIGTKPKGVWFGSPVTSNGSPRTDAASTTRQISSSGLSAGAIAAIQNDIASAANQPVKKKKKKAAILPEGAQLAVGTMKPGPNGTTVGASPAAQQPSAQSPSPSSQTAASETPKKKKKTAPPAIDTDMEPPPRNPARTTPSSPRNTRPGGALTKQPSMVREDPEAEASAETSLVSPARSMPPPTPLKPRADNGDRLIETSAGPAIPYNTPGTSSRRSASLEVPSPHAHFVLNTPTGPRHVPPPRSVSPVKSALKHSPASSIRTNSPNAAHDQILHRSDASDTTSVTSQDGIKPGKRKKSVRVSFDESTAPQSQASPAPNDNSGIRRSLSPTTDDMDDIMKPRPALPSFGSVRKTSARTNLEPAEKVTETLPSVSSSVSTLPDRHQSSTDDAVGQFLIDYHAKKSGAATSSKDPLPPQVTSVEGSGYHSDTSEEDEAQSFVPSVSLPETSQSDQQTGYEPMTTGAVNEHGNHVPPHVPDINVLPATPGLDEQQTALLAAEAETASNQQKRYTIPGSWDEQAETRARASASTTATIATSLPATSTGPTSDFSTDAVSSTASVPKPASPSTSVQAPLSPSHDLYGQMDTIDESDSDDSAAFSDAAEDPSEFDDVGGFASLDAIVESPMTVPRARKISSTVDSPSAREVADRATAPGDWTEATAYWSSLSRKHKEQLEHQAAVDITDPAEVVAEPKPKPKKKKAKAPALTQEVVPQPAPAAAAPRKSALKQSTLKQSTPSPADTKPPAMKKSMRSPQSAAPSDGQAHMRGSMRAGGTMRSSMRAGASPARPMSAYEEPKGALQKKTVRPASAGNLTAGLPNSAVKKAQRPTSSALRKELSNDSDSESSFKKKRRPSTSTVDTMGQYTMKRSMRAASVDERRPTSPSVASPSSRWSIRSASPPASRANFQRSLRSGSVDASPTMRGANSKTRARDSKSPSRFSISSFSRSSKPVPMPAAKPSSGFRSRFNDSDDEDEAQPARGGYRSRFVDSDEEDEPPLAPRQAPAPLTPVRGIPRRKGQNDDDSSDLSDSDVEGRRAVTNGRDGLRGKSTPMVPSQSDIDKAMEIARRNVAAMTGDDVEMPVDDKSRTPKRVTLQAQQDSPGHKRTDSETPSDAALNKRRGLFGSIMGRKRTNSATTIPRLSTQQVAPDPNAAQSPVSPRKGKLQRRNTPQLSRANSEAILPSAPTTAAQAAGMQQKVSTPGSMSNNSQNWPFPPPPKIPAAVAGEDRPAASDGAMETENVKVEPPRPGLGPRVQSSGAHTNGATPSEKAGKKKRFGKLRKAFGL